MKELAIYYGNDRKQLLDKSSWFLTLDDNYQQNSIITIS